jgi:hypothetical protein
MVEKITWKNRVKNEEVLQKVKDEREFIHKKKQKGYLDVTSCVGTVF